MLPLAFLSGVLIGWMAGRSVTQRINMAIFTSLIKRGIITWHEDKYEETIAKLKGK